MNYFKDPWSWVHFLGSALLVIVFDKFMKIPWSPFSSFAFGFMWEYFDELYKNSTCDKLDWLFDKNGFDMRDLFIMDLFGVVLGTILIIY